MALIVASLLAFSSTLALAQVYKPPGPLPFNIWVGANESWFTYPEAAASGNYTLPSLTSKPDFGIAVSGGGFRAATLGLGWLRALHMMNATGAARYLSSNSGGSWLNAAFSFQSKVPLSTFLGSYIPPQKLSMQQLSTANATPGSFEGVIANAGILVPGAVAAVQDAFKSLLPGQLPEGIGAWSATVGRAFLAPYDLNSDAATFTAAGTAGPVHQAVPSLPQSVHVYTYQPTGSAPGGGGIEKPFPIILGSILLQNTSLGFYPFEFTPLYVGCPAYFNDTTPPLGGGFTDPLGLNTPAPTPKPTIPAPILQAFAATNVTGWENGTILTNQTVYGAGGAGTRVLNGTGNASSGSLMPLLPLAASSKPDYIVPLKSIMGISSSFITNRFKPGATFGRELTGTEVLRYWSPVDFVDAQLPFADGGSADNTAVTPLLRRRVAKIVACVAANHNVTGLSASDWAGYQWDVAGLFGANPPTHPAYDRDGTINGTPVDLFNRKLQVFPTEGWQELVTALQNSTAAGGPTHHMATYTVITNPYQAIYGGWQVEVLWVINQQQAAWEAALPQDTAAALANARSANAQQKRQQQQQGSSAAGQPSGGAGGRGDGGLLGRLTESIGQGLQAAGQGIQEALSAVGAATAFGVENYPLIDTGKADYSPALTQALSQQATWQMLQLQTQLQQLLAQTNATLQPV